MTDRIKSKGENENFVKSKKNLNILKKLKKAGKVMKASKIWKNTYNALCEDCKRKVIKNPQMPLSEYCTKDQAIAETQMKKIKEALK